jgi:hypothetical protein
MANETRNPTIPMTAYPMWMVRWFALGCVAIVCGLPLLAVTRTMGSLFVAIGTTSIALSLLAGEDYDAK